MKTDKSAKAIRTIQRPNGNIEVDDLAVDPIPKLITDADTNTVSVDIGFSYQPYSPGKCSVRVTLGCDRNTDTMDRAAHIALRMAREYALDGMELIREDVESAQFIVPEEYRT